MLSNIILYNFWTKILSISFNIYWILSLQENRIVVIFYSQNCTILFIWWKPHQINISLKILIILSIIASFF